FCLLTASLGAQSPVVVQADIAHPGRAMPSDFCGLSYELKMVLPNAKTGKHYFSPANGPLIGAFQTLGIKHLRVGGNTAERATVPVPDTSDIDSLFAFARAADLKVIYTVRMEGSTPAAAGGIAKYVMDHYRESVSCFTVGNEPDKAWNYSGYLDDWKKFTAVIASPDFAPDAKFCGPSTRPQGVEFARLFANDVGGWDHLAYLTQHYYPGGDGDKITDSAKARQFLLSPNLHGVYQEFYNAFVPAVKAKGIDYRLEETNSYAFGGAVGASDTFTSSLWVVDYLYWWAWHDARGLNFHTGEKVARGLPGPDRPNVYTAMTSSPKGIKVLPLGYGLKLFSLGSGDHLVPVNIVSNPDHLNLSVYGALASGRTLRLTVVNRESGANAHSAKLVIGSGLPGALAKIIFMSAPNADITAINGVKIGGAEIEEDGHWSGKWSALPAASKEGAVTVIIPAASAAVIEVDGK
ncbi:MAG: hypothetical protein ABSE59_07410, partial [Opitutaceae bacterium]